jgi:hypothetical protein
MVDGNLITLCKKCHDDAPDEPTSFFKWAVERLPPDLEKSKRLTKTTLNLVIHRFALVPSGSPIHKEIDEYIETFYDDVWAVVGGHSEEAFVRLAERARAESEESGRLTRV